MDKMTRQTLTVTLTVEAHPQHINDLRQDLEDAARASIEYNLGYLLNFRATVEEVSDD